LGGARTANRRGFPGDVLFTKFAAVLTLFASIVLTAAAPVAAQPAVSRHEKNELVAKKAKAAEPVFWVDPGDIRSKDLFYGPGGDEGQPKLPFTYVKEDKGGTSPKFEVEDASGQKWKAKLGDETKPETVASRILWATGFAANTNYVVPETTVEGLDVKQKRAKGLIAPGGRITNVRVQRTTDGWEKVGNWNWRDKQNKGRREFNGLRVMMAVLSNWDLKGENNAIFADKKDPAKVFYATSDVGASFGMTGRSYTDEMTKNNVVAYSNHKFISKVTKDYVDFNFPTRPAVVHLFMFEWIWYFQQMRNHWVGRHIPLEDARWTGSLLGRLSPKQIRDAFRAANYSPDETEKFARALEARIAALQKL
jgi:hypothetical protein